MDTKQDNILNDNETIRSRFNKEFEKWDNRYKQPYTNIINYEIFRRRELIINSLKEVKGDNIKILEVGCGTANVISSIIHDNPNWHGFGIDISDNMIAFNKERYPNITFQSVNLDTEDFFENTYFDIIICAGVIGYLDFPKKALEKLHRHLNKDGQLIISFGNKNSFFRQFRNLIIYTTKFKIFNKIASLFNKNKNDYNTLRIYKSYSFTQFTSMLNNSFEILDKKYISFGVGIFGKLSVIQDRFIEKAVSNNGFLSLGRNVVLKLKKR